MPKTIVLAEDEKEQLAMIENLLNIRGYSVVTALDGEQAVQAVRRVKPDLAIFDVQMPHMDGDQAAMILKSEADTKKIPILFLTGLRTDKEIEESREEDVMAKPVHVQA